MPNDTLVIIPAYNAAASIDELLRQLTAHVSLHDIVVIDDGSADDTGDIGVRAIFHDGTLWSVTYMLDTLPGDADSPRVASNGSGYAVVWAQDEPTQRSIYATKYEGTTWTAPAAIENGSGDAEDPAIASNGTGYAAAWEQYDGTARRVFATTDGGSGFNPSAAIAPTRGACLT